MAPASPPTIVLVRAPAGAAVGVLTLEGRDYRCALGRTGIVDAKREGDGGTPAGRFALREVFWRPDRVGTPATGLPATALTPGDGWCDDPGDVAYNRRVRLPHAGRHEALWRDDQLYDLLVVIGWNDDPPIPGAGSAIFLHVAREGPLGLEPTAGCVALLPSDLRVVIAACMAGAMIDIAIA